MVRMRINRALGAFIAGAALVCSGTAQARLNIFACAPEWAAIARVIAPEANIFSATHARQDPHDIEARPALISALRRADLAICTGASLEAGWLPMLQRRAANSRVLNGASGLLFATQDLPLLTDAHHHASRDTGHLHAEGNPHIQLDPRRLIEVARRVTDRLSALDPASARTYGERFERWRADWQTKIENWQRAARPLFGQAVIAEHSSFAYLFEWLELYQSADLEPVPGAPPSPSHLQALLQSARNDPPMAVIQTLYQDTQAGQWLSQRLGVPLLVLPSTVTSEGDTSRLEGLFDHLVRTLLEAHRLRGQRR